MFVRGFELDKVSEIAGSDSFGNIPGSWMDLGWRDQTASTPEAFWRTLVADRAPNGLNVPLYYSHAWKYVVSQSNLQRGIHVDNLINTGGVSIMAEFLRRVQSVIWNRTLMRIKRGDFLGLGPRATEVGDCKFELVRYGQCSSQADCVFTAVCILLSCSVPVVLRKDPRGNHYKFLGAAYVHGMMDGDAISLQEKKRLPSQTFELR